MFFILGNLDYLWFDTYNLLDNHSFNIDFINDSFLINSTLNSFLDTLSFSNINFILLSLIVLIIFLLVSVAFFTLAERKVMGSIQRRAGPNIVGFLGLLQPIADGLKLIIKEIIIPKRSNYFLFILAPFITFVLSLLG